MTLNAACLLVITLMARGFTLHGREVIRQFALPCFRASIESIPLASILRRARCRRLSLLKVWHCSGGLLDQSRTTDCPRVVPGHIHANIDLQAAAASRTGHLRPEL